MPGLEPQPATWKNGALDHATSIGRRYAYLRCGEARHDDSAAPSHERFPHLTRTHTVSTVAGALY